MQNHRQWSMMFLAVFLIAVCVGCPSRPAPQPTAPVDDTPVTPEAVEPGGESPVAETPGTEPPAEAPAPEIPTVELTDSLAATCLVKVGDTMPEAELPALGGSEAPLKGAYGEKLTVLFFWNSKSIYAMTELQDLTEDVAIPFAEQGVRVIGINEGDTQEDVVKQIDDLGVKFANFLDPDGSFFAKVATERIPRTYLIDASGKILWFDMEYSSSTRRDMLQAVEIALGEQ